MKPEAVTSINSKYLLTSVNGTTFAIPSIYVSEICPSIKPTKLPFVPHYIAGLVNVKGTVIPLLSLSDYIGTTSVVPGNLSEDVSPSGHLSLDRQVFVIVFSGNSYFALAVDFAIDEVSSIDDSTILLDINQFHNIIHAFDDAHDGEGLLGKIGQQEQHDEEIALLAFQTLSERFCFSLTEIVEVIEVDTIVPIPGAPDCVEGLATIRDEAVLVLSFPALLGRVLEAEKGALKLLVLIEREQSIYAIDISTPVNIAKFFKKSLKKSHNELSQFTSILIDEQEQATIFIQSTELISDELHKKIKTLAPNNSSKASELIHYRRLLHITINSLAYAIPIDYVRMVSTNIKTIKLNDDTKNVSGIIEIEGRIISVLDASRYLGFVDLEKSNIQYVVIGDADDEWAVPVTRINQIIDIPETDIENISSNDLKHLSGIAHYQGQLIPVVNLRALLHRGH